MANVLPLPVPVKVNDGRTNGQKKMHKQFNCMWECVVQLAAKRETERLRENREKLFNVSIFILNYYWNEIDIRFHAAVAIVLHRLCPVCELCVPFKWIFGLLVMQFNRLQMQFHVRVVCNWEFYKPRLSLAIHIRHSFSVVRIYFGRMCANGERKMERNEQNKINRIWHMLSMSSKSDE